MMFLNSSRFCENHGFETCLQKKKSVTLFLKSRNHYKHFILKTTLKKRFTKLSVNQLPEFLKSDREIP